jgi:hypothetical protein
VSKNVNFEAKKKWKWPPGQGPALPTTAIANAPARIEAVDPEFAALLAAARGDEAVTAPLPDLAEVPDTPLGLMAMWRALCFAATPAEFDATWDIICDKFAEQEAILTYAESTYFSRKAEWAFAWTSRLRNYGQKSSQRTEVAHKCLKAFLFNSTADLYYLNERIQLMVRESEQQFDAAEAQEAIRLPREYNNNKWLGTLRGAVSRKAIDLVLKQRGILMQAIQASPISRLDQLPACTGQFTTQMGLPCSHRLFEKLAANEALEIFNVDTHWHLNSDPVAQDRYVHLVDPAVVINARGRPANPPDPVDRPAFQALRQEARERAARAQQSPRQSQQQRQQPGATAPAPAPEPQPAAPRPAPPQQEAQQNELVEDIWGVRRGGQRGARAQSNGRRQVAARARIASHDEEPRSQPRSQRATLPASLRQPPVRGRGRGRGGRGGSQGQPVEGPQQVQGWIEYQPNAAP